MGGNISVDSEWVGKGSLFTVHLPAPGQLGDGRQRRPPKPAEGNRTGGAGAKAAGRKRFWVMIDDDAAVRDLMHRFLGKLGFHVVTAANGEEGLRLAKRVRPRVITLDGVMQGVDGWGVLQRLKTDPELSKIPVIMVTIVDNEVMQGMNMGASNYLVKPVDRERLAELVEKYRAGGRSNESPGDPVGAGPAGKGAGRLGWNS